MKLNIIILSSILFVFSCAMQTTNNKTIILGYEDFGPQAAAWKTIGMQWWQWQDHGDSRPKHYDIKVVVFHDIALDEVKKMYPVNAEELKDYRYLTYREALAYLDNVIKEDLDPNVTEKLEQTKAKLVDTFK